MNLMACFENYDTYLEQVEPEYRSFVRDVYLRLRQNALPKGQIEAFLRQTVQACRQHAVASTDAKAWCESYIRQQKKQQSLRTKLVLRFSDFFIVLFLYAAIYETALDCLFEPLLNKAEMQLQFTFSLTLLANTLILYGIARLLLPFLLRTHSKALQYWAAILIGFLCFLGLTYVSRHYLDIALFDMNTLVFILICGLLAYSAYRLFRQCDQAD